MQRGIKTVVYFVVQKKRDTKNTAFSDQFQISQYFFKYEMIENGHKPSIAIRNVKYTVGVLLEKTTNVLWVHDLGSSVGCVVLNNIPQNASVTETRTTP